MCQQPQALQICGSFGGHGRGWCGPSWRWPGTPCHCLSTLPWKGGQAPPRGSAALVPCWPAQGPCQGCSSCWRLLRPGLAAHRWVHLHHWGRHLHMHTNLSCQSQAKLAPTSQTLRGATEYHCHWSTSLQQCRLLAAGAGLDIISNLHTAWSSFSAAVGLYTDRGYLSESIAQLRQVELNALANTGQLPLSGIMSAASQAWKGPAQMRDNICMLGITARHASFRHPTPFRMHHATTG